MNKEIKIKWLEALRSGEYKQATGSLRVGDTYCCLGVLCDLYRKETGKGDWTFNNTSFLFEVEKYWSASALPQKVIDWADTNDHNPNIESNRGTCLAQINDRGASFEEIADLIEAQL